MVHSTTDITESPAIIRELRAFADGTSEVKQGLRQLHDCRLSGVGKGRVEFHQQTIARVLLPNMQVTDHESIARYTSFMSQLANSLAAVNKEYSQTNSFLLAAQSAQETLA